MGRVAFAGSPFSGFRGLHQHLHLQKRGRVTMPRVGRAMTRELLYQDSAAKFQVVTTVGGSARPDEARRQSPP